MKCCTNLPGYADGGESVGPAREERRPAYQQNPNVVLTLLLQTRNITYMACNKV